jgi:hypothetical protein
MENLIEELTKVNPSNLSEEGLKLFNKINEIIDRNKEMEECLEATSQVLDNIAYDQIPIAIKELEEKYYYEKNRVRTELDRVYINARYDERAKWQSLIKETIEELDTMIIETHRGNLQRYTVSEILSFIRFCKKLLGEEK